MPRPGCFPEGRAEGHPLGGDFRYEREAQPLPKIGPWSDKLDQLLLANEGKASREGLTLIRLFEELRGCGYGGGYDAVRRYASVNVGTCALYTHP